MTRARASSPLAAVFFTVVIDLLGFGVVLPLLPRYAERYHAGPLKVGLLLASFSAMQFLFAPMWGRLSDRVGRRPVLLVGLGGSVAAYLLFAAAEATPWPLTVLFVSRVLAGMAGATISTASATIADLTPPSERGRGMALIGAAFGVGFTLGPVVGGLSFQLGPAAPGLFAAGFSALALAYAWARLPEPERRRSEGPRRILDATALRVALAVPSVPRLLVLAGLATAAFAMFESTLALFTRDRFRMDETANGWLFAWIGLCLILAQGLLVRRLLPRLGEVTLIRAGAVALGLGLLCLTLIPSAAAALYATVPLVVLGFAFLTPSLSSLVSRRTSADTQGEVLGLYQSCLALARIAGPLAGNLLRGVSSPLPYQAGAAALLVTAGLALGLRARD